ncbi:MAG TPA: DUF1579 family protein [Leptospiraceae bacterium]|nr:DUF1579 domain-containing protein [Leptospirales bacterium]HMU84180.1 DUF1579 family protein [Leptospiraceae bacterium]HMW58977.1 DUF1579 family protein [Leptospiraceae bacterium]HMX56157.1 DUF1579 family protein [Leptospiraceae bacterium]HMY46930.1 DUF1579 family protein [Leptospiraceae bacterium]
MREELRPMMEDEGIWDVDMEVRVPGQPVNRGKGVSTHRMACGGEWLIVDFKHENGFEGHAMYGFDSLKKKYTGIWIDTMRTFLVTLEGEFDRERNHLVLHGSFERPEGPYKWREVTERPDKDTRIFRHFSPGPDGEFEMIHAVYKRRP